MNAMMSLTLLVSPISYHNNDNNSHNNTIKNKPVLEQQVSPQSRHHNINYIEIPSTDIKVTKAFFSAVFNWTFIDFGADYASFTGRGIDGGFFTSENKVSTVNGSPLIVIYSDSLEKTEQKIRDNKGKIVKAVFSFPGGERFHFSDPSGNEYAVWSE